MLPKSEKIEKLDPRVVRTRRVLVQAFRELLEEKGLQAVTVRAITERAIINRATFYAHFDDKYDLFAYIIRDSFHQALRNRLPVEAEFNLDNLKLLTLAVFEYMGELMTGCSAPSRKPFRPMIETQVQQELYHLILNWIEPHQELKRAPGITASVLSWTIFGTGMYFSHNRAEQSGEEVANQMLALIAEGLFSTPKNNIMNQ